ncbi:MAG TPA: phosphate ABC transporter substrate-binding protein PstS [Candidatus Avipropionibacterium avicola]|uniref:Phosphate-binding protein n=1 Tax=Candidatus Avipropionibacterium avicola TaxID=2840701 RepID=A0A9D1KKX5_9ACTN|nr:phosphate ABC transporter substrate-binding protein PstS [Candidatus Avipropionibacterium avicola]
MKNRMTKLAALVALGTLGLAGCSSGTPVQPAGGGNSAPGGGQSETGNGALACPGGELVGSGSSAQKSALQTMIKAYTDQCEGTKIEYSSPGSGDGIKAFIAKQVDWAGTDSALKTKPAEGQDASEMEQAAERCDAPAWNLPMVVGPVAFAYNLDGITDLNLDAEVLAEIFKGEITKWNDPAIAALNEGVDLPDLAISVFFRSKESGTTENMTKYLQAASDGAWTEDPSKAWKGKVGEGKAETADVADAVNNTAGGLSYMEWGAALERNLGIAKLAGTELNSQSVGEAIDGAEIVGTDGDLSLELKYDGLPETAYPAVMVTYEAVCSGGQDAAKTALLKDFLGYFASAEGQGQLEAIGYAPLPESMIKQVEDSIAAIK